MHPHPPLSPQTLSSLTRFHLSNIYSDCPSHSPPPLPAPPPDKIPKIKQKQVTAQPKPNRTQNTSPIISNAKFQAIDTEWDQFQSQLRYTSSDTKYVLFAEVLNIYRIPRWPTVYQNVSGMENEHEKQHHHQILPNLWNLVHIAVRIISDRFAMAAQILLISCDSHSSIPTISILRSSSLFKLLHATLQSTIILHGICSIIRLFLSTCFL